MTVYKVVEKETRLSTNWAIFQFENKHLSANELSSKQSQFLKKKIIFKYNQGSVISSSENTLGIMCFNTPSDAYDFIHSFYYLNLDIIKVSGIGEPIVPSYIIARCGLDPTRVLKVSAKEILNYVYPKNLISEKRPSLRVYFTLGYSGSVAFPKVEVLT